MTKWHGGNGLFQSNIEVRENLVVVASSLLSIRTCFQVGPRPFVAHESYYGILSNQKNWPRAVERPPGGAKQSVRKSEQVSKNGQISHMNISDKCRKNYYAHIYVPSNALRPSPSSHNSAPYGGRRRGQKESIYISAFSNRDVLRARLM